MLLLSLEVNIFLLISLYICANVSVQQVELASSSERVRVFKVLEILPHRPPEMLFSLTSAAPGTELPLATASPMSPLLHLSTLYQSNSANHILVSTISISPLTTQAEHIVEFLANPISSIRGVICTGRI